MTYRASGVKGGLYGQAVPFSVAEGTAKEAAKLRARAVELVFLSSLRVST